MWYLPFQKSGPFGSFIQFAGGIKWNWGRCRSEASLFGESTPNADVAANAVAAARNWRRPNFHGVLICTPPIATVSTRCNASTVQCQRIFMSKAQRVVYAAHLLPQSFACVSDCPASIATFHVDNTESGSAYSY